MSKKTLQQVADQLTDPSSTITRGIVGTANVLTASICETTGEKPSNVCTAPAVKGIESKLATR